MKKVFKVVLLSVVIIFILGFAYLIFTPPGCRKDLGTFNGVPVFGGCFGKQRIINISKKNQVDCLSADVNDCNEPNFYFFNKCEESVIIDGEVFSKGERYKINLKSGYYNIQGSVGEKVFRMIGFVTPQLCK